MYKDTTLPRLQLGILRNWRKADKFFCNGKMSDTVLWRSTVDNAVKNANEKALKLFKPLTRPVFYSSMLMGAHHWNKA